MLDLPIQYHEPVFRPPSEARSLILQLTLGCSWNRCTYCAMYRGKSFEVRPLDELVQEIRAAAPAASQVRRVFLADGDALAAPQEVLEQVLVEISRHLPGVSRVGIYADSRAILSKGVGGLAALRRLGLGIIYFGPETGDPVTLRASRKGATVERQLEACQVAHQAGIKLSLMVLLGLAGIDGSRRHAEATGRFLVEASPTFAAALTVTPVPGTEMHDAIRAGTFALPDRWGLLRELQWMLEQMKGYRGQLHANHASSYLPLKLRLPRDHASAIDLLRTVVEARDERYLRPEWSRGL